MSKLNRIKKLSFPILTLITATVVPGVVVLSTQPAEADLFCYPWETGCTVDGQVGTSGNDIIGGSRDGFVITVNNRTGTRLQVNVTAYYEIKTDENSSCLHMVGVPCGGPQWKTFGPWDFAPGESALILNGANGVIGRNATFKARSADGRIWEREVDMGSSIGDFAFTFR